MQLSCHSALNRFHRDTDVTIALAGNPNVGKSSIFNSLTGMGVETANYPGKTVEVNMATTSLNGDRIGIIDLPGTYALGAISEDQWVARQSVLDGSPDVVVIVLDATNMARNLYMVIQFLELGYPMVVALNVLDVATREGRRIQVERLSKLLGVPVIPTVANRGKGLEELMRAAVEVARKRQLPKPLGISYGLDIENNIEQLTGAIAEAGLNHPYGLPHRALALLLLENDPEFVEITSVMPGWEPVLKLASKLRHKIEDEHGQSAHTRIACERHALAGLMVDEVETREEAERPAWGERMWRYTTSPVSGVPILFAVLALTFLLLYFVGSSLADLMSGAWADYVAPPVESAMIGVIGDNVVSQSLMWAVAGIEAALTVGIPYVLVFYILLAFLEDMGYLNSVAFLTDSVMHKFGIHGRAAIPIVAGAGCNVPAIIGTRTLSTLREKVIAGTLIVLVPCSARNAIIFGAVAFYAGWQYALGIYVIIGMLWVLVGLALNKVIPGHPTGLVMEMFPFRRPHLVTIAKKTWHRFKDFLFLAVPILLIGSVILGSLLQTGLLFRIADVFGPVVEGWMGLPAVAGLTLIMGILRKELALQLLITMAIAMGLATDAQGDLNQVMSNTQLFIFALVCAIYIPCASTIAALARELGWRRSVYIMAFTIALAVLVGGLVNQGINLVAA